MAHCHFLRIAIALTTYGRFRIDSVPKRFSIHGSERSAHVEGQRVPNEDDVSALHQLTKPQFVKRLPMRGACAVSHCPLIVGRAVIIRLITSSKWVGVVHILRPE